MIQVMTSASQKRMPTMLTSVLRIKRRRIQGKANAEKARKVSADESPETTVSQEAIRVPAQLLVPVVVTTAIRVQSIRRHPRK